MYFTGSAAHNIKMRNEAIAHGFSLSDAGLYRAGENINARDSKKEVKAAVSGADPKIQASMAQLANTNIIGTVITERQIFKAFGMEFVEPCNRIWKM